MIASLARFRFGLLIRSVVTEHRSATSACEFKRGWSERTAGPVPAVRARSPGDSPQFSPVLVGEGADCAGPFQVAAAGHFVGCECFDEEAAAASMAPAEVVGVEWWCAGLAEDGVVGADEIEQGDAVGQGGPAEFVGPVQGCSSGWFEEGQEGGRVVLGQPVQWGAHGLVMVAPRAGWGGPAPVVRVEDCESFVEVERGVHGVQVVPSRTMVKATSGLIPTITVLAPRRPPSGRGCAGCGCA